MGTQDHRDHAMPQGGQAAVRAELRAEVRAVAPDDRAVSHVVGFILMFAIAFMVLSLSLVFVSGRVAEQTRRDHRTSFTEAAATVASAVQEAVTFADLYPDSTFERTVVLPEPVRSTPHELTVTDRAVYLNSTRGDPKVEVQAGGFDLAAEGIAFDRTVLQTPRVLVTFLKQAGVKTLTLGPSP